MGATSAAAAVVLMAKAPRAGQVKTRLCPPLSPAEAARLYGCFLRDTIARVRSVAGARPVVAYAPRHARAYFVARCPDFRLVAQRGSDLGGRLASAFATVFADGATAAVAIGGDTPTLPTAFVRHALGLLADGRCDAVLGPSRDGGYYLIGLRRPRPELFADVPWSTPQVLAETLRRAGDAGLRTTCLPPWSDVDTPDDLARLSEQLRGDGEAAPHTRRFLARRGRW